MMSMARAILLDEQGNRAEAASAYEELIQGGKATVEVYENLAFVYFEVLDPGTPQEPEGQNRLFDAAQRRYLSVWDDAAQQHGHLSKFAMWRSYFAYIVLGEDVSMRDMERWLVDAPEAVVYLFPATLDTKYILAAREVVAQSTGNTSRSRYVRGVLEAALLRFQWGIGIDRA